MQAFWRGRHKGCAPKEQSQAPRNYRRSLRCSGGWCCGRSALWLQRDHALPLQGEPPAALGADRTHACVFAGAGYVPRGSPLHDPRAQRLVASSTGLCCCCCGQRCGPIDATKAARHTSQLDQPPRQLRYVSNITPALGTPRGAAGGPPFSKHSHEGTTCVALQRIVPHWRTCVAGSRGQPVHKGREAKHVGLSL